MGAVDLWVDFNELDSENRLCSLVDFLSPGVAPLQVGGELVVGDYEGNSCKAEVVTIEDRFVGVAIKGDIRRSDGTTTALDDDSRQYA